MNSESTLQTCIPVFHFLNGMRAQQRFLKCRVRKCNCIVQDGFYKGWLGKCFMTGREYFGRHIYPRNVQCTVTMYIFTKILCIENFHLWKFISLSYAIEAFANCHSLKSLNSQNDDCKAYQRYQGLFWTRNLLPFLYFGVFSQ